LLFTSLSAAAPESVPSSSRPRLSWAACDEDHPGIECATFRVPLDYDAPRGPTTQLALARVPASDPAHKVGTLFVNPGGPGGSGVDLVLGGFGVDLEARLLGRFDIVGFDPRGVARSEPFVCFDSSEEAGEYFGRAPSFPYLPEQEDVFFDVYAGLADRCLSRRERIAEHMSTADVARDLDQLRAAVGDAALTYLGFSYGTQIGNTYANLFPQHIRALAIDGVLDPRVWTSGLQIVDDRVATEREFVEFLQQCDAAGSNCALTGPEGAAARFSALEAALLDAALSFDDGSTYTYENLIGDANTALYVPEFWGGPNGFGQLFAQLALAVQGDAAARSAALAVLIDIYSSFASATDGYDNSFDAYNANVCADTEFPSQLGDYSSIGSFAADDSRFGPSWWWGNAACAEWPVNDDRYPGPWTAETSAPVLVVGNYFDGVTSYEGAVASSELLPNSRLLSYAGWGHTAFERSDCVTEVVVDYLLDGALPPEGTVCPANPNPFVPVAPATSEDGSVRSAQRQRPWIGLPRLRR